MIYHEQTYMELKMSPKLSFRQLGHLSIHPFIYSVIHPSFLNIWGSIPYFPVEE